MTVNEKDFYFLEQLLYQKKKNTMIDFTHILKIIHEEIERPLSQNAPPNFAYHFGRFEQHVLHFLETLCYHQMVDQKIVTFAGAFSTGKSSFINTLLQKNILPSDIQPSTAVPTYIQKATTTKTIGTNLFDEQVELKQKDFSYFSHLATTENETLEMRSLLKNLKVETPRLPYEHLVFVDTPGYSKSDATFRETSSDEIMAKSYLATSDFVFWFVSCEVGTITEQDLLLLATVKKEIPIVIVLNKADKLTDDDLAAVEKEIKKALDQHAIPYVDIYTFSKRHPEAYDYQDIHHLLTSMDQPKTLAEISAPFDDFFEHMQQYYTTLHIQESRRLYRLNTAITLLDDYEVINNLTVLVDEIKTNMKQIHQMVLQLRKMESDFFGELLYLGRQHHPTLFSEDSVHVPKPKTSNFLPVLREHKKNKGYRNHFDFYKEVQQFAQSMDGTAFATLPSKKRYDIFSILDGQMKSLDTRTQNIAFGKMNYRTTAAQIVTTTLERTEK